MVSEKGIRSLYNSFYGHEFMTGVRTGKVLSSIVAAKKCARCVRAERLDNDPEVH